jgi:hypothetical protein
MLKTYSTPCLTAKGDVVEVTTTRGFGRFDPIDTAHVQLMPAGSQGFLL